jgi:hypothetical protein
MRNYSAKIIILLSLILVFGLPKIGIGQEEGYSISEQQGNFAQYVQASIPGVIKAEWKSPVDLWVEADSDDPNAAKKIAQDVVYVSQTQQGPGQSFCVHVHDGDYIDLSKICWSAP